MWNRTTAGRPLTERDMRTGLREAGRGRDPSAAAPSRWLWRHVRDDTPRRRGVLHDAEVVAIRVSWILMAIVTVLIGIEAATSSMAQITSCETGLYSREVPDPVVCGSSIRSYFGSPVVPVLTVPVGVCLIPVVEPGHGVAWMSTVVLFALSSVGLMSAFSPTPRVVDLYGFFWPAVLAAVAVTGITHWRHLRRLNAPHRSPQPG